MLLTLIITIITIVIQTAIINEIKYRISSNKRRVSNKRRPLISKPIKQ